MVKEELYGITRDELHERLKKFNIFTRKYFYPLCTDFECYKGIEDLEVPNAEYVADRIITLPIYSDLTIELCDYVCDAIEYIKRCNMWRLRHERNNFSRWYRLTSLSLTKVTNKHLLPVGKYPMIFHSVHKLKQSNIGDILIVTEKNIWGRCQFTWRRQRNGVHFTYKVQDEAGGIAQALNLAEHFVGEDQMVVILGDNVLKMICHHSWKISANKKKELKF